MKNLEKYREVFTTTFGIGEDVLETLEYQGIVAWDSVGHMQLISALEEAFDIMFDTDDIIDLNSYKTGMQILRKYEVVI